jgi:hypothetical protein
MSRKRTTKIEPQLDEEPLHPSDSNYPAPLKLDIEKYRDYVDGFDMSEKAKIEHLEAMWLVAQTFVDLAWGVDSTQLAMKAHWEERLRKAAKYPRPSESRSTNRKKRRK